MYLACYDKFNLDCLKHLRGMFSFAIWDERKKDYFVQEIDLV